MQDIRLVHIIPTLDPGGAERLLLEYVPLLAKHGYDVSIIACVADGSLRKFFESAPCHLFVAARPALCGRVVALWKTWKYLSKIQPDILHTHLITSDVIGWLWKFWHRKAIWVSTLHNLEHNRPWWYKVIWRFILPRANRVVAVSEQVADFALRMFRLAEPRLIIIKNGINLARWQDARGHFLFQNEQITLATIGRLEEQKGHADLFLALSYLKNLPWLCHIFGEGSLRDSLVRKAQDFGIANRLLWRGVSHDLPREFESIDIIIQPSRWEGMSLAVMEAMAAGKCVVATKAAGDGLVVHGVNGYLVPNENPTAMAMQLRYIFEHKDEARANAERARTTAKRFSIDQNVNELIKVYEDASGRFG